MVTKVIIFSGENQEIICMKSVRGKDIKVLETVLDTLRDLGGKKMNLVREGEK